MLSFTCVGEELDRVTSAGRLLCGVVGMQSMQEHVVESAGCSLVGWRQAIL